VDDGVGRAGCDQAGECARCSDVSLNEREARVRDGPGEVRPATGAKIIHAGDTVAGGEKAINGVTADESGGAGDDDMSHD
jgi:hypothetical protein